MNGKKQKLDDDYLQDLEIEETEYYDTMDLTEPSTSNGYQNEKFNYASEPAPVICSTRPLSPQLSMQRNRLRAPRGTSSAVTDAAEKNGMQIVENRSGSSHVIPISMEAHPTQLNDRVLDEKNDILSQIKALPYCCHCNSTFKSWRGFEYHVLQIHVKYRPYRCYHCQKETFYTEEEGRFHSMTAHPEEELLLVKEHNPSKEAAIREAVKDIFMMCRDGPKVTREVVDQWELEAAQEVMRFHFLRFKRPIVLVKKLPTHNREAQTDITQIRLLNAEQQSQLIFQPQNVSLNDPRPVPAYTHGPRLKSSRNPPPPPPPPPQNVRPRSTATQLNEDPRDREKRLTALLRAVNASRD